MEVVRYEKEFDGVQDVFELQVSVLFVPRTSALRGSPPGLIPTFPLPSTSLT